MKIALILDTGDENNRPVVNHLLELVGKFVRGNTLLIDKAEAHQISHDGNFFLNAKPSEEVRVLVLGDKLATLLE